MKIQTIFSTFSLRAISAAICATLVSSCAYETYPPSSSIGGDPYSPYGNGVPYRNTRTVSDPTIPLILGASAIGALAYFGKKRHDDRHRSHYYHRRNHHNHYRHTRAHTTNHRHHNNYRNNHSRHHRNHNTTHNSRHNNYNRNSSYRNTRNNYRNSTRKSLERKRDSQRSKPHHSQVVSTSDSRNNRSSNSNRTTRSRVSKVALR